MSASESSPTTKQSSSESAQPSDSGNRGVAEAAGESQGSGLVEQSVAVAPELEATEGRYRDGLLRILSRVASNPFEVNHAVEDLRALVEGTVRREVGVLRKEFDVLRQEFGVLRKEFGVLRKEMDVRFEAMHSEMNARLEALESQFRTIRWMLGAVITLLVALFTAVVALIVIVVNLAVSVDRSGTPPPPSRSATVQAPAESETVPSTGAVLGSEGLELPAPSGSSVTADQPADESAQ